MKNSLLITVAIFGNFVSIDGLDINLTKQDGGSVNGNIIHAKTMETINRHNHSIKDGIPHVHSMNTNNTDNNDNSRSNDLGLFLKPWRKEGNHILLCGQHDKSLQWKGMPPMSSWVTDTVTEIRKYSDRVIVFRPHPRCQLDLIEAYLPNVIRQHPVHVSGTYDDFDMSFEDAWATISWSSNPGIHSVINGVPAYTGPSSLAYDVSMSSLSTIEDPILHDREQWLNDYAWTEFTVEEIEQGLPLKRLENYLKTQE